MTSLNSLTVFSSTSILNLCAWSQLRETLLSMYPFLGNVVTTTVCTVYYNDMLSIVDHSDTRTATSPQLQI